MDKVKHKHIQAPVQLAGMQGVVTFTTYEIIGQRAEQIDRILEAAKNMSHEMYSWYIRELQELTNFRTLKKKNLIVQAGRAEIMKRLNAETTGDLEITHGLLGSGDTAPVAGNTTLETEFIRKTVASRGRTNTTLSLDFYYSKADWSGTAEEFGTVLDGTATADTGVLFNRLLTGGWDKSATEALTVSIQFDLNAA